MGDERLTRMELLWTGIVKNKNCLICGSPNIKVRQIRQAINNLGINQTIHGGHQLVYDDMGSKIQVTCNSCGIKYDVYPDVSINWWLSFMEVSEATILGNEILKNYDNYDDFLNGVDKEIGVTYQIRERYLMRRTHTEKYYLCTYHQTLGLLYFSAEYIPRELSLRVIKIETYKDKQDNMEYDSNGVDNNGLMRVV